MASLVLGGTLPPAAAGAMLDGLKGLLLQYARAVVSQLSSSELVPPIPALVRYKREVVAKAETATAMSRSTQLQRFCAERALACQAPACACPFGGSMLIVTACDPQATGRLRHDDEDEPVAAILEAERRCATLTPSRIGTLLNSLQYIKQQFPSWSQRAPAPLPLHVAMLRNARQCERGAPVAGRRRASPATS
jgi:hypothetical protein